MAACSISETRFNQEILQFMTISEASGDTWFAEHTVINGVEYMYIVKKETLLISTNDKSLHRDPDIDIQTVGVSPDDSSFGGELEESVGNPKETCSWEYHVVYSQSYGVPVLYFTAQKTDGSLMSLEEVWKSVPKYYQDRLVEERWTFITEKEHPFLRRPFFQLHPCHTTTLLKQVLGAEQHRTLSLLTWLSSVGPVVHLNLPVTYASTSERDLNQDSQ